ncbi:uncharacterized protein LOC121274989 isoform X2 [Carcharodon carcharias]|uniref:uncharacterized protein LOC121274989 isoform X2 n=1 Tax=Carcharodon carcharias TaxID=13397 RepID=UPI001B7DE0E6|nr:uncharacterized protein LOC121274989 isoform X2 [Carcharodon carcharias]
MFQVAPVWHSHFRIYLSFKMNKPAFIFFAFSIQISQCQGIIPIRYEDYHCTEENNTINREPVNCTDMQLSYNNTIVYTSPPPEFLHPLMDFPGPNFFTIQGCHVIELKCYTDDKQEFHVIYTGVKVKTTPMVKNDSLYIGRGVGFGIAIIGAVGLVGYILYNTYCERKKPLPEGGAEEGSTLFNNDAAQSRTHPQLEISVPIEMED